MRFEIPFNENISREDSKKYFDFSNKNYLSETNKIFAYGIGIMFFGSLMIYGKSNAGLILFTLGVVFIYLYFVRFKLYRKNKERYYKTVEKHILEYSSNNKPCIWEFNEEQFIYSDFKYDLKINWSSFTKFRIIENNLILELRDNIVANFFLNKEKVGKENFDKIIHFLEGKIKNQ